MAHAEGEGRSEATQACGCSAVPDIWEQLRQEIATRKKAKQATAAPRRKAKLILVYAAATGRVMSRMLELAHPTGDG